MQSIFCDSFQVWQDFGRAFYRGRAIREDVLDRVPSSLRQDFSNGRPKLSRTLRALKAEARHSARPAKKRVKGMEFTLFLLHWHLSNGAEQYLICCIMTANKPFLALSGSFNQACMQVTHWLQGHDFLKHRLAGISSAATKQCARASSRDPITCDVVEHRVDFASVFDCLGQHQICEIIANVEHLVDPQSLCCLLLENILWASASENQRHVHKILGGEVAERVCIQFCPRSNAGCCQGK